MSDSRPAVSRRQLLVSGIGLPLLGGGTLVALSACGKKAAQACVDAASLPSSQRSLRESLQYTSQSPRAEQACAACAFFQADTSGACGHCQMIGGVVDATGHCNSWSPKG